MDIDTIRTIVNDKVAGVKYHLKDNKKVYIIGAAGVAAGVIGTVVFMHGRQIVINDSFNVSLLSPKENLVTTILERRGHPGMIVRVKETGEVFASKNRAAEMLGINRSQLIKHLRGELASVNGLHLEELGLAS